MTATCAIIPTSGLGERLSSSGGKAFVRIAGQPLIAHTLAIFQQCPEIDYIVLVARPSDIDPIQSLVDERHITKVTSIVPGGSTRQDSVRNGLNAVPPDCDIIAIHDGARPLVSTEIVRASIEAARKHGGAVAAVPVIDTIKVSNKAGFVASTPDRHQLFAVQTPQTFRTRLIKAAYQLAFEDGYSGTDDASLVEHMGNDVAIVSGSYDNIKVTVPRDILLAEAIMQGSCVLQHRDTKTGGKQESMTSIRVGHGYDIHRFAPGRRLFLGGIEFPGEDGLLGHSDADVLLHAVADAVLGAAAAKDIGHHFPDTDSTYKDASSLDLLATVGRLVTQLGWQVANIDVTLIAQRPKVAKYAQSMCENIASALTISPDCVNVKATTAEGLGDIGQGLGIECHAVALLARS